MNDEAKAASRADEVRWTLKRKALFASGQSDAFVFALEYVSDPARIEARIREYESYFADPTLLAGPLKPTADPGHHSRGYLHGLREARDLITQYVADSEITTQATVDAYVVHEDQATYSSSTSPSVQPNSEIQNDTTSDAEDLR
jgi:hypothetical protein